MVEDPEPKEDTMSRIITEPADLHSPRWEMGTVIQEIHTGECCAEPHCDFYQPLWEMGFQVGWCRAGKKFDPDDDDPRLPVRVLYDPLDDPVLSFLNEYQQEKKQ